MIDFMGIKLKNPIILAASPVTETAERIKRGIEAGAGAAIVKSISTNAVLAHKPFTPRRMCYYDGTLFTLSSQRRELLDFDQGMRILEQCKKVIDAPIISSITWEGLEFMEMVSRCRHLTEAGADMIQIDTMCSFEICSPITDSMFEELVRKTLLLQKAVKVPIMIKICPSIHVQYAIKALQGTRVGVNLLDSVPVGIPPAFEHVHYTGFRGVKEYGDCLATGKILYPLSLLYTQKLSKSQVGPICSGGGVFTGNDAAGLLVSGATCVQVATSVCVGGFEAIGHILKNLEKISRKAEIDVFNHRDIKRIQLTETSHSKVIPGYVPFPPECNDCSEKYCQKICACEKSERGCEGCGLCITMCPNKRLEFVEVKS